MRAISLKTPGAFVPAELPEAAAPRENEALVRIHRIGICGTDLHAYLGKMPFIEYPRILGHELGVEVLSVGTGVSHLKAGDRCSVEPYLNNPKSFASRRGSPNCCEELKVLGVHIDGGMCERLVLPANKLHVSNALSYDQLALVETLGIGCHAVSRAQPRAGDYCLVIGAGPIGLSTIQFLLLAQAKVIVMDVNPQRLAFCRRSMHVDHTIHAGDGEELSRMKAITGGDLPMVVIDATGSVKSMSGAIHFVGHTGKLVFLGLANDNISFPQPVMHRRELTFLASRNALPEEFTRIIQMIEAGTLDTRPWITHRTKLSDVPREFAAFTKPETGAVKAMIEVE